MTDYLKYTIFSVDNHTNLREYAKFLHYLSVLEATKATKGNIIPCIGSYEGYLEPSFICLTEDFRNHIVDRSWVKDQECVMEISECNKKYTQLRYQDGSTLYLGCMKDVPAEEAYKATGFTYRPDMDTYWVAVKGNPDHV